ncbi:MAG: hypothetical protein WCQ72_00085 [Eubacteriales bacterium]
MDLSSLREYNGMTLELVIWSLFVGVVIGAVATVYIKRILGSFVRRLLESEATAPECAKTLDEAGLSRNFIIRGAVTGALRGGKYHGVVQLAPQFSAESSDGRIKARDITQMKFYIPQERVWRAGEMYDAKGSSIITALIAILTFLIVALISFQVIPYLTTLISDATGMAL